MSTTDRKSAISLTETSSNEGNVLHFNKHPCNIAIPEDCVHSGKTKVQACYVSLAEHEALHIQEVKAREDV